MFFSNDFHDKNIGERVTITARSSQKIDLIQPLTVIKDMFIPKKL
jgi:hypothetical protein